VYVELTIDVVHLLGVVKDQRNEDIYGTLMRKPEPERVSAELDVVEQIRKQDASAKRHGKPDDENLGQQTQRGFPVGMTAVIVLHEVSSFSVIAGTAANSHRTDIAQGWTMAMQC
jgi:hypothetical protein